MSYLDLDFKTPSEHNNSVSRKKPTRKPPYLLLGAIIFLAALLMYFFYDEPKEISSAISQRVELEAPIVKITAPAKILLEVPKETLVSAKATLNLEPEVISSPLPIEAPILKKEQTIKPITVTIKNGDSLSAIFKQQKINPSVLYKLVSETKHGKLLKSIRRGQDFIFQLDEKGTLETLTFIPDITEVYTFTLSPEGQYNSSFKEIPLDAVPTYREGTIDSSLFLSAEQSDIPVNVIMNLVAIFAWDIDFALDIRKGDSFRLIYNELFQNGEAIKTGKILAAEFTNRGKTYRAFSYTDPTGKSNYYSSSGKSMRKAFLRNPVKFSRISSRFTNKRWHPILSKWRSHKGVDYAASRGTPILAAGDGKVIHKGLKGGYGRAVVLQHGGKYTTLYAHMNSYSKKIRSGKRVKQGQVIGYVGSSGLASGPHLHYEFRVAGVHRNPLTVKLPAAQPINKKYKADFEKEKKSLATMLSLMSQTIEAE